MSLRSRIFALSIVFLLHVECAPQADSSVISARGCGASAHGLGASAHRWGPSAHRCGPSAHGWTAPALRPSQERAQRRTQWKELCRDLRSPYPDKRRRTIAKLGGLGTNDALALVLERLADPDPEPADEAQRVVVQFEDVGAARRLLGREGLAARDPLVQRRAAEAIGRLRGPVDGRALAAYLDRAQPERTRTVLWTLERLAGRDGLGGDLAPVVRRLRPLLARSADDGVRAAALQALVAVEPGAARDCVAAWTARTSRGPGPVEFGAAGFGPRSLCSALEASVRLGLPSSVSAVSHYLGSEHALVRAKAIELASAGTANRATLDALAARLKAEPRTALRERALAALRKLTGMRHGPDVRAWTHTIEGLARDWSPPEDAAEPRAGGGDAEGRTVAALRRLQPRSDRLAILVDFSGSLWNERPDGTCRKDLVDPEMTELLSRLDPAGTFFLVPFTHETHPFSDQPQRATTRNVRSAQRFFERARMRGQGNLADAIQLALEQPGIDRVLILTDGAPTGGSRWNVDLMIEWIRQRLRFRPAMLDFVLIDTPPGLSRKWRALSESTGGRTMEVKT